MSAEYCVCCGEHIPEGSWVCANCIKKFHVGHVAYGGGRGVTICGVPIEEAKNILTLYRLGIICPNKDYYDGLRDGYKLCQDDWEDCLNNIGKEVNSHGKE